ncbi:MAG TPA: hypothetical protein VJ485_00270 [archaeon]|nr:hypothetical protein [archaeon]
MPSIWGPSKSKKSCPKTIRDQLRVKWWKGKYDGPCFCCGRKISYENVEAGRIKAGGKYSVPNTRLICKVCNRGMGKQNLKIYMRRNFPERYEKYFPKSERKPGKPHKNVKYWKNPITGKKEPIRSFW